MNTLNSRRFTWIIIISFIGMGAFLLLQSSLMPLSRDGYISTDTGIWLAISKEMLNGKMVYRDLFDHKGPVLFWLFSHAYHLGGITGVWMLQCVTLIIAMILCYWCAMTVQNNRMVGLYCTAALALCMNRFQMGEDFSVEALGLPFMYISLLIFISYFYSENRTVKKYNLVLLGFCAGGVFFLRQNMIALWMVYALVVIGENIWHKRYKDIAVQIVLFIFGFVLIAGLCVLWLWSNSSLAEWWNKCFLFNFYYSDATNWHERMETMCHFGSFHIFAVSFCLNVYLLFRWKEHRIICAANLLFMVINLLFISISGRMYNHYAIVLVPGTVLPLACCGSMLWDFFICREKLKKYVMYIFIAVFVMSLILLYGKGAVFQGLKNIHDKLSISPEEQETLDMINYISNHTTKEEKISVIGNSGYIYLDSDRYSATSYIYTMPVCNMSPQLGGEFCEQLEKAVPPIIVVEKDSLEEETDYSRKIYSLLERKYDCIENFDTSNFRLYEFKTH